MLYRDLDESYNQPIYRKDYQHNGSRILILGILSLISSLCCPFAMLLGIYTCGWGANDLVKMKYDEMDPSGIPLTIAGMVCGIIGTTLNTLIITAFIFSPLD